MRHHAGADHTVLRQHAGIGLPAPRCRPLDDAVGLGSGGYFVSCVLPEPWTLTHRSSPKANAIAAPTSRILAADNLVITAPRRPFDTV